MNNQEANLRRMLQGANMEAIERIAQHCPAADADTRERIYRNIRQVQEPQKTNDFEMEVFSVNAETKRNWIRSIGAVAACLLLCGGAVTGIVMYYPTLTDRTHEAGTETETSLQEAEESKMRQEEEARREAEEEMRKAMESAQAQEEAEQAGMESMKEEEAALRKAEEEMRRSEQEQAQEAAPAQ